jgi:hypothetical protein
MIFTNPFEVLAPSKKQLKSNEEKVKTVIKEMGNKWRLHPDNYIKRKPQ